MTVPEIICGSLRLLFVGLAIQEFFILSSKKNYTICYSRIEINVPSKIPGYFSETVPHANRPNMKAIDESLVIDLQKL